MSAVRNPSSIWSCTPAISRGACAFYAQLCGWRTERIDAARAPTWRSGSGDGAQRRRGRVRDRSGRCGCPTSRSPDVAAATERARALGASVLLEPREGPAGWRSVVAAPAGGESPSGSRSARRPGRGRRRRPTQTISITAVTVTISADQGQPQPDPDQPADLGADVRVHGHSPRGVGVHHRDRPHPGLGVPVDPLLAPALALRDPERLGSRWGPARVPGSPRARVRRAGSRRTPTGRRRSGSARRRRLRPDAEEDRPAALPSARPAGCRAGRRARRPRPRSRGRSGRS